MAGHAAQSREPVPVAPLPRVAADLGAIDVTARPADLDELFLAYYRGTPGEPDD